jgi:hypothetical protein
LASIFLNRSISQSVLTEIPAAFTRLFKVRRSSSYLVLNYNSLTEMQPYRRTLLVKQRVDQILKEILRITDLMRRKISTHELQLTIKSNALTASAASISLKAGSDAQVTRRTFHLIQQ